MQGCLETFSVRQGHGFSVTPVDTPNCFSTCGHSTSRPLSPPPPPLPPQSPAPPWTACPWPTAGPPSPRGLEGICVSITSLLQLRFFRWPHLHHRGTHLLLTMIFPVLIQLSIECQLGCYHIGAVVNRPAVDVWVHMAFEIRVLDFFR